MGSALAACSVRCSANPDEEDPDDVRFERINRGLPEDARLSVQAFANNPNTMFCSDVSGISDYWEQLWYFVDMPPWTHTFEDPERGTKLFINTYDKTFQFTADAYDSGVIEAKYMKVYDTKKHQYIRIKHKSKEMKLYALIKDGRCKCSVELTYKLHSQ